MVISKRIHIRWIVAAAFLLSSTLGWAQLLDRNRLKKPIFRMPLRLKQSKNQGQNPAAPPIEAAPVVQQPAVTDSNPPTGTPTPRPANIPATLPQQQAAADTTAPLNTNNVPPAVGNQAAVGKVALAAPLGLNAQTPAGSAAPPALPANVEPTPQQLYDKALDDAQASLDHMKAKVRDYTCDFVKRERVGTELVPTEVASMKIRNRVQQGGQIQVPLSVYLKFSKPTNARGREALFVEGKNNDKILCKEGGGRRFLPAMWLAQNSPLVMATNRYPISQIGMTRLAERLVTRGRSTPVDNCDIKYIPNVTVAGRACSFLSVVRPTPRPGIPVGHNNVNIVHVFIDTQLNMPIRFVAYDWPASPGGNPRLIEEYTYTNIKVNVGLNDNDFSRKNKAYNF